MMPFPPVAEPVTPEQRLIDALVTLHTRTVDTRIGYEKMLEKAEPEFRPTVQRFHAMHEAHASGLAAMLAMKGYSAEDEGSVMGSINRVVVAVRSFFDNVDADLMTEIHDGEEYVLTAFSDAIAEPLPLDDVAKLSEMRDELVALLAQNPATA